MVKNSKIPENYQTVMPYLIVNGAEKFIEFMKQVFDAEETHKTMRDKQTVMHAEIMIGGSTIMFADSTDMYGVRNAGMFIYVDDADAVYKKALDAGATIVSKITDQGYGRSGGVKDPFGNIWWITGISK
jgi:PhnB protein